MPEETAEELGILIASHQALVVVETVEEERLGEVLNEVSVLNGMRLFDWTVSDGLRRLPEGEALGSNTLKPAQAVGHIECMTLDGLFWLKDFGPCLQDENTVRRLREAVATFNHRKSCIVISGHAVDLPAVLDPVAARWRLKLPGAAEMAGVIDATVASLRGRTDFEASLAPEEKERLAGALVGLTRRQARQAVARAVLEDGRLDADDIAGVGRQKAKLIRDGGLLEYYAPAENAVSLGGFERLKGWLARTGTGFTEAAKAMNLEPPKGILLVGVQGCGKSLAAKAVAREWSLPLLKLDAGALYNKYIGETERNFREAMRMAESVAPCVMWVDEIEKAFAGGQGDGSDGGTSRRLLGAFLTWLQEKKATVFVVGTANDIDAVPPELLRKGRFDEVFFVDLPTAEERAQIFLIHLGRRNVDVSGFDPSALVEAAGGFSGAEIEQVVVAAAYHAVHLGQALTPELVLHEIGQTVPLSVARREDVEALRAYAKGRFVPVV